MDFPSLIQSKFLLGQALSSSFSPLLFPLRLGILLPDLPPSLSFLGVLSMAHLLLLARRETLRKLPLGHHAQEGSLPRTGFNPSC